MLASTERRSHHVPSCLAQASMAHRAVCFGPSAVPGTVPCRQRGRRRGVGGERRVWCGLIRQTRVGVRRGERCLADQRTRWKRVSPRRDRGEFRARRWARVSFGVDAHGRPQAETPRSRLRHHITSSSRPAGSPRHRRRAHPPRSVQSGARGAATADSSRRAPAEHPVNGESTRYHGLAKTAHGLERVKRRRREPICR